MPQSSHDSHVSSHRLGRGLGGMTVDLLGGQDKARDEVRDVSAGNMAQQILLEASGSVGAKPTVTEVDVTFPNPFGMTISQGETDSNLTRPHFTSGLELLTDARLSLDVQLVRWKIDDSSLCTGCSIRLTAVSPGAGKKQRFAAIIHLSFTGYAIPLEDEDETGA